MTSTVSQSAINVVGITVMGTFTCINLIGVAHFYAASAGGMYDRPYPGTLGLAHRLRDCDDRGTAYHCAGTEGGAMTCARRRTEEP